MSVADPSSFPLSSGAVNLVRITQDGYTSTWQYRTSTYLMRMQIRHSVVPAKGGEPAKDRHNVEVVKTTFATASVPQYSEKSYFVTENVVSGSSVELPNALCSWLTATSNAQLTKLLNWET